MWTDLDGIAGQLARELKGSLQICKAAPVTQEQAAQSAADPVTSARRFGGPNSLDCDRFGSPTWRIKRCQSNQPGAGRNRFAANLHLVRTRCNHDFLRANCRHESSKIAPTIGTRAHPAFTSGTGRTAVGGTGVGYACAKARTGSIMVAARIQILRIWVFLSKPGVVIANAQN